jgi:hypothetical protein
MAFQIGRIEAGGAFTPLTRADGTLRLYKTGKHAARAARVVMKKHGGKVQPRVMADEDWKARERGRFDRGEYTPIACWQEWVIEHKRDSRGRDSIPVYAMTKMLELCPDHFAHVSVEKKSMVAFTPSDEYGAANRKLRLSPGTYLQRFYSGVLTQNQITSMAREFGSKFDKIDVQFARTRAEIRHVYENGPHSCMSSPAANYSCQPIHPSEAYAGGDLAIAYIRRQDGERVDCGACNGDEDAECICDTTISARCLCWPDQKVFGATYGDSWRLEQALERDGWKGTNAFVGARLAAIECTNWTREQIRSNWGYDGKVYALPYFDFSGYLKMSDDGASFVVVGRDGAHDGICGGTSGIAFLRGQPMCPVCSQRPVGELLVRGGDGQSLCRACVEAQGLKQCAHTQRYYPAADMVTMAWGVLWHRSIYRAAGGQCCYDGLFYRRRDMVTLADGRTVYAGNHSVVVKIAVGAR